MEEKKRFKMYKKGKFWVIAPITFIGLISTIGLTSHQEIAFADEQTSSTENQVISSTPSVDEVTTVKVAPTTEPVSEVPANVENETPAVDKPSEVPNNNVETGNAEASDKGTTENTADTSTEVSENSELPNPEQTESNSSDKPVEEATVVNPPIDNGATGTSTVKAPANNVDSTLESTNSEETKPQKAEPSTQKVDTDQKKSASLQPFALPTSGTFGTSNWYIDNSGTLHIGAGEFAATNGRSPFSLFNNTIKVLNKIVFDGAVKAHSDSSYLFSKIFNLKSIENLSLLDTSNVTNMRGMFAENTELEHLDISHFDTRKVTDMSKMFEHCWAITSLDPHSFDTRNVMNMSSMFVGCTRLKNLDVSNFDTSKVTDMSNMFSIMSNLTSLNISHFNTSKVTNMFSMFGGASKLTSLDISHFDTSNVTSMQRMFANMQSLSNLNLSNLNTANVVNMKQMFYGCDKLTSLDLSHFNTSKVTDMDRMFGDMSALTTVDISNFDTSNVSVMKLFRNSPNVQSIKLGNKFKFIDTESLSDILAAGYTGRWIGINTSNAYGSSKDFMIGYDGAIPDTYVWEKPGDNNGNGNTNNNGNGSNENTNSGNNNNANIDSGNAANGNDKTENNGNGNSSLGNNNISNNTTDTKTTKSNNPIPVSNKSVPTSTKQATMLPNTGSNTESLLAISGILITALASLGFIKKGKHEA